MTSNNPWNTVRQSVVKMLSDVFSVSQDAVAVSIEKPPDPKLGDLASTIAFSLAKEHKKSPAKVVKAFLSKLGEYGDKEPLVREIKTKGPYVNIFLDHGKMAELTVGSVLELGDAYGHSQEYN
ncbi:MAG: hypothetical protein ACFFBL_13080, partial [Promethearchaeota archaeon]